jgi:site-specific DNA-methyltransferase (adenine-specific)
LRPYHTDGNVALYDGDLRNVLPGLPEACVDYVVTDPPYGLSFMGEGWDSAVPGPDYWRAIARVCKPGALLAAFGGTRTWHRLVCAIEDAGWEIRDTLMWLQGQGFPKSADVGKLIDKAKGAQREVVGDKLDRPGYHLHEGKGNGCYGGGNGLHAPGTDARLRAAQITAPATELAKAWTGWASALKPAWEPIILAMKPMDGTIGHNAETWGVAGMNIDACRIGDNPGYKYNADHNGTTFHGKQGERIKQSAEKKGAQFIESTKGRWPANLLLDEEAAAQLDAQTGTLTSGKPRGRRKGSSGDSGIYGSDANRTGSVLTGYGDTGGASRFFYCGKATRKERGEGNDHATVKPLALMDYLLTLLSTPTGGVVLDPFAGSGSTLVAAKRLGRECIGVELDVHNCEIAVSRLNTTSR